MTLYSNPPPLRDFDKDKPSLLVCWWITAFCSVIILLRVAGRFIRSERLFREDRVAALALIPLFIRMGCVHVVLLWGTNNAQLEDANLTAEEIRHKSIASGLVLASRIFYAATLWILKNTILEYFKRLTESTGERYASHALIFIRCTFVATFIAIIISTFAECQPFDNYWQVLPQPAGQCRQAYAQLLTMATCNILTDLLLVFFPIPIILRSHMGVKKKVQLTLLFSLSLAPVAVTCYRVPHIIDSHGQQQLRSLLASVELLFATTAANSLVLGSFVRDRGVKKKKFKYGSIAADSLDRTITNRPRRPTLQRHWGSDEDLVRDVGLGVDPDLRNIPEFGDENAAKTGYIPAPVMRRLGEDLSQWQFPQRQKSSAERSDESLIPHDPLSLTVSNSTQSPHRVNFFDVGGLLTDRDEPPTSATYRRDSYVSSGEPVSPGAKAVPSPAFPASASGQRRGSTAILQDLGGLMGGGKRSPRYNETEMQPISSQQSRRVRNAIFDPTINDGPELNDVGGLLK